MAARRPTVALICGIAALLAAAGAVATSAQATTTLRTGSATGPLVAVGSAIRWSNTAHFKLTSTFFGGDTDCTVAYLTTNVMANPNATGDVKGDVGDLSFSGCTCANGTAATMTVHGLPWIGAMTMTKTTSPSGLFKMAIPNNGISISCYPLSCDYGGTITGVLTGGNPGTIDFVNVALTQSSCFDTSKVNIVYASAGPAGNGLYLG